MCMLGESRVCRFYIVASHKTYSKKNIAILSGKECSGRKHSRIIFIGL